MTYPNKLITTDVHGCFEELVALLVATGFETDGKSILSTRNTELVFLGDMIDRGPYPVETILLFEALSRADMLDWASLGNHDERLLKALLVAKGSVSNSRNLIATLSPLATHEFGNKASHAFIEMAKNNFGRFLVVDPP